MLTRRGGSRGTSNNCVGEQKIRLCNPLTLLRDGPFGAPHG